MSERIDVLSAGELADGQMVEVEAEGHKLLLARVGDAVYASDAHCPHLHGNLTKGTLAGTIVTCPLHGSQFDLRDGSVVRWTKWHGAAKSMAEFTRHPRPLRVYEVAVEGGRVRVDPQKEPPAAQR